MTGRTFLAEYGVFFATFFGQNTTPVLGAGGVVPTSLVTGGFRAASNSLSEMNQVNSDIDFPRDLVINRGTTANMTFTNSSAAFVNTTGPLTITFTNDVGGYMRSQSYVGDVFIVDNVTPYGNLESIGTYSYSVVPEPSTYAAIAGALGLGYAVYRRRRQAAAVTAAA